MKFAIEKSILGSEKHLVIDGENKTWTNDINDIWIYGNNVDYQKDLKTAFYLSGYKINDSPPEHFVKSINHFGIIAYPKWEYVMPSHDYEKFINKLISDVQKGFMFDLSYYENVYKHCYELISGLSAARIHKKKWKLLDEHKIPGINPSVISSFKHDKLGFAKNVEYSLLGTVSGRLTTKSGPKILLLNKELKDLIKSRYKNGKIVNFDFVSLEPILALYFAGKAISGDVYDNINEKALGGKYSRDVAKKACLSILYGAGHEKLAEEIGLSGSETASLLKTVKEYFDINTKTRELSKEYKKNGYIKNCFGRVIWAEDGLGYKLYNNFIQSSAVDVALLGFSNIVKNIDDKIKPIFIIHDNLMLDFPPEMANQDIYNEVCLWGTNVPNIKAELRLSCDIV